MVPSQYYFLLIREEELSTENSALAMEATSLGDAIDVFLSNLMGAESAFRGLQGRLNNSASVHSDLQVGVAVLERRIRVELRELLEEARTLSQNLATQVSRIWNLAEMLLMCQTDNLVSMCTEESVHTYLLRLHQLFLGRYRPKIFMIQFENR